jgi:hypothetical protein
MVVVDATTLELIVAWLKKHQKQVEEWKRVFQQPHLSPLPA